MADFGALWTLVQTPRLPATTEMSLAGVYRVSDMVSPEGSSDPEGQVLAESSQWHDTPTEEGKVPMTDQTDTRGKSEDHHDERQALHEMCYQALAMDHRLDQQISSGPRSNAHRNEPCGVVGRQ